MFKKFIITSILFAVFVVPAFSQSVLHETPLMSNGWVDSLMIRTPLMNKSTPYTRQSPSSFKIYQGVGDSTLAYRMWPVTTLIFKGYNIDSMNVITMGGIVGGTSANNYVIPICTTLIRHPLATLGDTATYVIVVDGTTRTNADIANGNKVLKSTTTASGALPAWDVFWVFKNPQAATTDTTYIKEGWVIRKRN